MKILVTGAAGFIGFHLTKRLLSENHKVIGIDNLNNYYDVALKKTRLKKLEKHSSIEKFKFIKADISDRGIINKIFEDSNFEIVINLAAQAGVRYSIKNPYAYVDSNLNGFVNILEGCRLNNVNHFIFASSSSVYGMNTKIPFNVDDRTDHPISLYAATKKSNELIAHSYSHLFNIPITGLRFFTVYGEYGRPDMAYYKFTKSILNDEPIDVFNNGDMKRDFTYIDDIVNGILKTIDRIPQPQNSKLTNATPPFKVYNIGNNNPVTLRRFISAIEAASGKKAIENMLPMQPGDVPITYANIDEFTSNIGFTPKTSIETGIMKFVEWYKNYNKNEK